MGVLLPLIGIGVLPSIYSWSGGGGDGGYGDSTAQGEVYGGAAPPAAPAAGWATPRRASIGVLPIGIFSAAGEER